MLRFVLYMSMWFKKCFCVKESRVSVLQDKRIVWEAVASCVCMSSLAIHIAAAQRKVQDEGKRIFIHPVTSRLSV